MWRGDLSVMHLVARECAGRWLCRYLDSEFRQLSRLFEVNQGTDGTSYDDSFQGSHIRDGDETKVV